MRTWALVFDPSFPDKIAPSPRKKWARRICSVISNSAADCSISLKCDTEMDHVTADTLQTFKVKGSDVKVTA